MSKGLNVVSLFDGKSCGMIALNKAGIKVNNYFASEIDKYAQIVSYAHYPEIKRLGDVRNVSWIGLPKIDLLIGGSPCQGFSFAGKQLNFDDPRSKLFFEFVRIKEELNPKYFLLENVKMKKEYQDVISEHLGVEPIEINSALVSAQNRKRLYWSNIPGIEQPEDKNIKLSDILTEGGLLSNSLMSEGWYKWWDEKKDFQLGKKYSSLDSDKAITMTARQYASWNGNYVTLDLNEHFKNTDAPLLFKASNGKVVEIRKENLKTSTFYETRTEEGKRARREAKKLTGRDTTPRSPAHKKYVVSPHNKANCIVATRSFLDVVIDNNKIVRCLTPRECERLQCVPDNYTKVQYQKITKKGNQTKWISNSQRYKMLGNGWTIDVIAHFFKNLK